MTAAVGTTDIVGPAADAPAIPATVFRMAGPDGWLGRLSAAKEISDLVVLRPRDHSDRDPPMTARLRLAQTASAFPSLKRACVEAILDARRHASSSAGPNLNNWRIVEARIDRDGRAWLGLYEHVGGLHETWMVELDDQAKPAGVWRRAKRDVHNLADCGQRVR